MQHNWQHSEIEDLTIAIDGSMYPGLYYSVIDFWCTNCGMYDHSVSHVYNKHEALNFLKKKIYECETLYGKTCNEYIMRDVLE